MVFENYLISIITPVKKGNLLFKNTYKSVISQTFKNFKWIIVYDDNVKDFGFIDYIGRLDKRIDIKFSYSKEKGAGIARNIGLKYADGDFITFIDSDDEWQSSFLNDSLSFLLRKGVSSCFSGYKRWSIEESKYLSRFTSNKENINAQEILRGCDISCLTFFARNQNTLPSFGSYRARNDLVFFYKYLKLFGDSYNTSYLLGQYNISKNSISSNKLKLIKYQFLVNKNIAGNSFIKSLINSFAWVLYGINKYYLKK